MKKCICAEGNRKNTTPSDISNSEGSADESTCLAGCQRATRRLPISATLHKLLKFQPQTLTDGPDTIRHPTSVLSVHSVIRQLPSTAAEHPPYNDLFYFTLFFNLSYSSKHACLLRSLTSQTTAGAYLSPGLQHSQLLHGGGALAVELAGGTLPSLHLVQGGHQQVVHTPQVIQVADHATADPGTAHLDTEGQRGRIH